MIECKWKQYISSISRQAPLYQYIWRTRHNPTLSISVGGSSMSDRLMLLEATCWSINILGISVEKNQATNRLSYGKLIRARELFIHKTMIKKWLQAKINRETYPFWIVPRWLDENTKSSVSYGNNFVNHSFLRNRSIMPQAVKTELPISPSINVPGK